MRLVKLRNTTSMLATALLVCSVVGCKPKHSIEQVEVKTVYMPQARTCPDGMPGHNHQVTTAIGESNQPVIVWTGESFAIAWWDLRGRFPEVRVKHLSPLGESEGPAMRIPNKAAAKNQSLSWDGEHLSIVFNDGDSVMAQKLDVADSIPKMIAEVGVTPIAGDFGAAIWVNKGNLFFRSDTMLDPDDPEGEDLIPTVIASGGIETPQLAFNGEFYAVVWSSSAQGGREILMQRVSLQGMKVGPQVRVSATAGISRKPMIAWSGSDFAIAWTNAAPGDQNPRDRYRVFFAVVPSVGDAPRLTRQLQFQGSADQVALAATGTEFAVAWVGSGRNHGSAVYIHRISTNGEPMGETTEVTDGVPLTCGRPSIAWDGAGFGVTWHDDRSNTDSEVFFAYVDCGEELPEPVEQPDTEPAPEEQEPKKPGLKDSFAE